MATKKKISATAIIEKYMDYVLEQGSKPKSVYLFAKENNFEEQEFYSHFSNFDSIEKEVFNSLFTSSVELIEKDKAYQGYSAKNKLLSLYFTFFENLTANRSYCIYSLSAHKNNFKNLAILSTLKKSFTNYIDSLEIDLVDLKQEKLKKAQEQTLRESAWIQFLITLKFWMEDSSQNFEKTDIYIEKSVNTSFDVMNALPLKSMIDFGKFLIKEKMATN